MSNSKFELLKDDTITYKGHTLYRIRALKDIDAGWNTLPIKAGSLGGYIEKEKNLGQTGNCWVDDDAKVYGYSEVYGNARVSGYAVIENSYIYEDATIYGFAYVKYSRVSGDSCVNDNANVSRSSVRGYSALYDYAHVVDSNINNCAVRKHGRLTSSHIGSWFITDSVWLKRVNGTGVVQIAGDAVVDGDDDYIIFKNWWSSGRYFVWTRRNNKWTAGCFHGTGEELIKAAYKKSKDCGDNYKMIVDFVNTTVAPSLTKRKNKAVS